ncbi:MAG: hypothetical protein M1825_001299 [Sarcosagium campestre]|nr:MAG: hypothetical protein M1825_001299 [Sarcosagium campestre]
MRGTRQPAHQHSNEDALLEKGIIDRLPPSSSGLQSVRRKRILKARGSRHDESVLSVICAWVVEHQIGLATNLIILLSLTHICFPRARPHTRKFFELSYYRAATGKYTIGLDDTYFVAFWIIAFTGLRAGMMDFVLIPFAQWGNVEKRKGRIRFAEQAWLFVYYAIFLPLGMYIFYNSPYWLDTSALWNDWPNNQLDSALKWYYLVQFAFWLQQILVVNIEERRKDYHQMFTHHIITCALMFTSYTYFHTRVGNVILCLMDVVDIVLPVGSSSLYLRRLILLADFRLRFMINEQLAKMLKYLHFQIACDIAFGVFLVTWFVARHVLYLVVCWSVYTQIDVIIPYACYSPETGDRLGPTTATGWLHEFYTALDDPTATLCFSPRIKWGFLSLLLALQVLTLMWFGMILRVAWRVINGGTAEDSRSDDEEEEEKEEEAEEEEGEEGGEMEGRLRKMAEKGGDDNVAGGTSLPQHQRHPLTNVQHQQQHAPAPLEQEVGVEGINLRGRTSPARRFRKSAASASGVTLPGHSDRKELLGRIGCDKTT